MQRLRFLDTLGVACALLCASHVFVVQNGYACNWHAELVDYTTHETTHLRLDATPVTIPLLHADKGVHVHCSLEQSAPLSIGIFQRSKVDILCRYPDEQMLTTRAINIVDTFTGENITYPVMLFFSNARKHQETLYRLHVDCH